MKDIIITKLSATFYTFINQFQLVFFLGFPSGSDSKESACSVGDPGSISGSGRSPGEGNGNPLPLDRRAWQATVHEVTESQTLLSD